MIKFAMHLLSPAGARARLSILIFHRVLPALDPLAPSEPDAQRFRETMQWVKQWFNVLSLPEAVQRLRTASLPERAAAITFDDGYADNEAVALPILQSLQLPATFFVSTGFLDGGRMWNDSVIEAIRACKKSEIDLSSIELGRIVLNSTEQRRAAISTVLRAIKHLPQAQRQQRVDAVVEAAQAELPINLMMSSTQVKRLHAAGMTLGAHTVTHPILTRIDAAAARREIHTGKEQLEAIIGERVTLFAYPNGVPQQDYDSTHVRIARDAGFDAAVSTAWGAARRQSDLYQLPRFTPWDRTRGRYGVRLVRNLAQV